MVMPVGSKAKSIMSASCSRLGGLRFGMVESTLLRETLPVFTLYATTIFQLRSLVLLDRSIPFYEEVEELWLSSVLV